MLRLVTYLAMFAGIAVMVALLVVQGLDQILGLLADVGLGLLLMPLIWMPSQFFYAWSWQLLFAPGRAPGFWRCLWATFMARAVNNLLPVAQVGGEIVKARAVVLRGTPGVDAAASAMVDKTVQALAMFPWALTGIALLALLALGEDLIGYLLAGLGLVALGVGAFIAVQRAGLFRLFHALSSKVIRNEFWRDLQASAEAVDREVRAMYGRRLRFGCALLVKLLGLVVQVGEVWLAARLLGQPIGWVEAALVKSLVMIASDLAFIVPNAYGVQEGAYVMAGALVGLDAPFMLAVSLATRVRELLIDLPGLLLWQHLEAKTALARRRAGRPAEPPLGGGGDDRAPS